MKRMIDSSFTDITPAPQPNDDIERSFDWMRSMVSAIPYGEVGLSFVLHAGKIVRIRKTIEETKRVESTKNGP